MRLNEGNMSEFQNQKASGALPTEKSWKKKTICTEL